MQCENRLCIPDLNIKTIISKNKIIEEIINNIRGITLC